MRLLLIVTALGSTAAMAQPVMPAPAAPQAKTRMGVSVTVIETPQPPKTPEKPAIPR